MKTNKQAIKYDPSQIEGKWLKVWRKKKTFTPDIKNTKKPYYNLMMFPYPSAEGMHVGNMYAFTGADIWGRFQRMQGKDVFEPIGLDGFGIHSENYAIKINEHPVDVSKKTEKRFYAQLEATGNSFDWTRTLETYDPDYYRWTQWLFVQMFKHGLAYRQAAEVNWCLSCKTVLADEQVISGQCERCGSVVEKRKLEQWFFKITDYADRLLENLEKIDWAQKVKVAQKNWIGKSEGVELAFRLRTTDYSKEKKAVYDRRKTVDSLTVFTTRPDTLYGVTFLVIGPDSPLVKELVTKEHEIQVSKYLKNNQSDTNSEAGKVKTGVFTGSYAINPANKKKIPVWIANYVVSDYGAEAVMGVPAHDARDFEFASKYNLEIASVIRPEKEFAGNGAYTGPGKLINSDEWNGIMVPESIDTVLDSLIEHGWGTRKTEYHLRDWLISRQRYWGSPIPMVYCEVCASRDKGERGDMPGWYTVPEAYLPVKLPFIENYRPTGTGESPLAQDISFVETSCPGCGGKANRETDVSDTFLDSAWYFLRYTSTDDTTCPWRPEIVKKWLPVNMYIGGAEHSVLHLMYSRFVCMALKDWGIISHFEEPFTRFYAHGLIIKNGAKMSKSKGNVVNPDKYIAKFGADTLRTYLMFLGPFDQGGDFRDTGIEGMHRFIKRVWELVTSRQEIVISNQEDAGKLLRIMHKTIKRATEDMDDLRYNRAIAGMMEYVNSLREFRNQGTGIRAQGGNKAWKEAIETLLLLLAPFAPFMTEELWEQAGGGNSIHLQIWPKFDTGLVEDETMVIPIQVNGRLRGSVEVEQSQAQEQAIIEKKARKVETVAKYLTNVKKVIFVPGKLLNFVV